MRILGAVLIVLGLVVLLTGGFSWTQRDKVVDLGPVEVTKSEHKRLPMSPIAGGVIIVAGVACLFADRRRLA